MLWLALTLPLSTAHALDTTWDASLYAYPETRALAADSALNPDNRVARLAERLFSAEARLNLSLEGESARLSLRPIFTHVREESREDHQAYLAQWKLRLPLGESLAASVGREVMNWGPAQFRSPSSPFYFDNGRGNPQKELSGVDMTRLTWTPDRRKSASLAFIQDRGHGVDDTDPWRNTWLGKLDLRGDDWAAGLALARPREQGSFLGAHGQWTLDEAWLLYGELASSTRADALASPADRLLPFRIATESERRITGLLGATRTFGNGQSLSLEWLHDGHGFSLAESRAYFARAAMGPATAATALAFSPPLLNRNYLHGVWQSNLLDGDDYWRLMVSRNLDDRSHELAAYGEHALSGGLTLFALGVVNLGGPRREFASLIEQSLTLGLRLALP